MSKAATLLAVASLILLADLPIGCTSVQSDLGKLGDAGTLAGTWEIREVGGHPLSTGGECAAASTLTINADGQIVLCVVCGKEFDLLSSEWIDLNEMNQVRGISSAAGVAADGTATVEIELEVQLTQNGTTSSAFARLVLTGQLSDDGQTLDGTLQTHTRLSATGAWIKAGSGSTLVLVKG